MGGDDRLHCEAPDGAGCIEMAEFMHERRTASSRDRIPLHDHVNRWPAALDAIGDTPVTDVPTDSPADTLLKWEQFNPAGSMKDRVAAGMILQAEAEGIIETDTPLVEPSSGNTAAAFAFVSQATGHPCTLVVPPGTSQQKIARMEAYGAKVVVADDVSGGHENHYVSVAKRRAENSEAVCLNQYGNELNALSHYYWTGPELYEQVGDDIDYFVMAMGTGGTISGIARYLTEQTDVCVVGVDAELSAISQAYEGRDEAEYPPHDTVMSGVGKHTELDTMWFDAIDRVVEASPDATASTCHRLRDEGFLLGWSGGAVVTQMAEIGRANPDATLVGIAADSGLNYQDTLYDHDWLEANEVEIDE